MIFWSYNHRLKQKERAMVMCGSEQTDAAVNLQQFFDNVFTSDGSIVEPSGCDTAHYLSMLDNVEMSDEDKRRVLAAVTGSDGKIDARAAAALIAAAASGGDPDIANKMIEKMMAGLGDEIDPAMMAALMATTALVARGASNEEVAFLQLLIESHC